jgi:hypothetical protein
MTGFGRLPMHSFSPIHSFSYLPLSSCRRAPGLVTLAMSVTFLPHGRFSTAMGSAPFFVPCTFHAPPSELMLRIGVRGLGWSPKSQYDSPVHRCR